MSTHHPQLEERDIVTIQQEFVSTRKLEPAETQES